MFYTIYKITNNLNGKFYIGKHQTKDLQDDYMGSGKLIRAAIEKYGIDNFTKEILHIFDTEEEMNQAEKDLVVLGEQSYNLCEGGKGGFGYIHKNNLNNQNKDWDAIKAKLSKAITGKKRPDYSERLRQLHRQGFFKESAAQSFLGKTHTNETKLKMSLSHQGKHDGHLNSQYGTCWITNGTENKKIKKDDLDNWVSLGYHKGRK